MSDLLGNAAGWLEAIATAALAVIAVIQVRRELQAPRLAEDATDARIGPIAFLLRRQLRSWIGTDNMDLFRWIDRSTQAGTLRQHLDRAESRAEDLAALASGASPSVRQGVSDAFVFLCSAAEAITHVGAKHRDMSIADTLELLDAKRDVESGIAALERAPIPMYLQNSQMILEREHQQENPFYRLADEIRKELPPPEEPPEDPVPPE